jgi:MFS family permease
VLVPLGIGTAVSLLGDNTLYTVLPKPDIAAEAGVTLGMVGVLLGANRLFRVLLNGPVGLLFDRLPRRGLLLASLFLGALSTAVYAFTRGFVPLLVGRLIWGLAWSGIWIGGNTMVLDISDDANRGRLSGQFQMWFFLGVGFSSVASGTFTDVFGFRGGLALSAGLTGLAALMWLAFLPETRPAESVAARSQENAGSRRKLPWGVALVTSTPLFFVRFVFAGVLAATSIVWLGGFFGQQARLLGLIVPIATLTGVFGAVRMVTSIGGAPLAGSISDRLGRRWPVIAGSSALATGGLWLMGGQSVGWALLGALLAAITSGSVQAMSAALAGDRVEAALRSRTLGMMFTLGDLGSALGPPCVLWLLDAEALSLGEMYRVCAILFVGVMVFAVWQASRRGRLDQGKVESAGVV